MASVQPRVSGARYEYTALKENEIRLLKILPGTDSEDISCSLTHVSLFDLPEYAALSYTWGQAPSREICVDGRRLLVTPNLEAALREFRSRPVWLIPYHEPARFNAAFASIQGLLRSYPHIKIADQYAKINERLTIGFDLLRDMTKTSTAKGNTPSVQIRLSVISKEVEDLWEAYASENGVKMLYQEQHFLWIDAACVDQGNLEERADQVKMMRKIYKGCKCLTVWLGPEENNSRMALAALRQFKMGVVRDFSTSFKFETCPPYLVDPEEVRLAIHELFCRPWFCRSWVAQEFVLGGQEPRWAPDAITFCCGKERMSDLIKVGVDVLEHLPDKELYTMAMTNRWRFNSLTMLRIQNLRHISRRRLWTGDDGKEHPTAHYSQLSVISELRSTLATDPRDKVYAFLGLSEDIYGTSATDFALKALIIDYSATVEDIYSSFVRAVVEGTKRLDILGASFRWSKSEHVKRSWTPDWTASINPASMMIRDIIRQSTAPGLKLFTYDATPGVDCIANFSDDLSTLTVTGLIWDQIVGTSEEFGIALPEEPIAIQNDCQKILHVAQESSAKARDHGQAVDFEGVLLRILTWSFRDEQDGRVISDIWKEAFQRWISEELPTDSNGPPLVQSALGAEVLESTNEAIQDHHSEFLAAVKKSLSSERIILTRDSYIGRSESIVKVGDVVCILLGCAVPMVLRPVGGHYEVVAEAFVPGIMHGEAMTALNEGRKTLQEFELQ